MGKQERDVDATGLQYFVAKAMVYLRESPTEELFKVPGCHEVLESLYKDARIAEAKMPFGRQL